MDAQKVVAVCSSEERGTGKRDIGKGYLRSGYGLVGDAHAGSDKQVSLLALEDIRRICAEKEIEAGPGDFAENITTSGIDLVSLPVGTRLQVGETIVKVTRIGKEKHLVHTYNHRGISILPQRGVFASVEKSGKVTAKFTGSDEKKVYTLIWEKGKWYDPDQKKDETK